MNSKMKWQLCPMCKGQGTVNKPPWISGDQKTWISNQTQYICKMCNGNGKIKISEEEK
jgi:DnaJ-class molecular chaperone